MKNGNLQQFFSGAGQTPFPGTSHNPYVDNGLQACLITAKKPQPIVFDGHSVGVYMEDDDANYALLGGLHPLRAVVYMKEESYRESYNRIAAARGLTSLPAVCVQADICRDDLLFEIELDAAIAR